MPSKEKETKMFNETYNKFTKGDKVTATQDLHDGTISKGEAFRVFKVIEQGEISERIYWVLDSAGEVIAIKNGHINLGRA